MSDDGGDREAKQEESAELIFATLALLAARTLDAGNAAHGDLVRALQACAEKPWANGAGSVAESARLVFRLARDYGTPNAP
jgi:hypothetical protein